MVVEIAVAVVVAVVVVVEVAADEEAYRGKCLFKKGLLPIACINLLKIHTL